MVEQALSLAVGKAEVHHQQARRGLAYGLLRLHAVEGHPHVHAVRHQLAHEDAEEGGVVIGQQHVRAAVRRPEHLQEMIGGRRGGDLEPEGAALSLFAVDPDLAAVLLDDGLADGEAEAGAALLARVAGLDLAEALEDGAAMGGGHAAALVDDLDARVTRVLAHGHAHRRSRAART